MINQIFTKEFKENYWQKKPFLFKSIFKDYSFPLDENELAGLSLEEEIASRIIKYDKHKNQYKVSQGPFKGDIYDEIGDEGWTLLVQEVDQVIEEVSDIKDLFCFVPKWRIDDVMISFAAKDGGVGPHFDFYDVFLIGAKGTRTWELDHKKRTDPNEYSKDHTDLKILDNFKCDETINFETGDMLYIPAGIPHNGISLDASICYSIGLRLPSLKELVLDNFNNQFENILEEHVFSDEGIEYNECSAEIPSNIFDFEKNDLFRKLNTSTEDLIHFFGRNLTTPKRKSIDDIHNAIDFDSKKIGQSDLIKSSMSRFAYYTSKNNVFLFIDGTEYILGIECLKEVKTICNENILEQSFLVSLDKESAIFKILTELCSLQVFYI